MHPVLFNLGPIPIHTYGVMIAIGFLIALEVIKKLSKQNALDVEKTLDLTFWLLISGFVGARTLFILTRWDVFSAHPFDMFKVWEGGLVFFGGPLAALPVAIWFVRKHRIPLWKTFDALVPALTIAHAFGRIGCLAAGCCYGKPTDSVLGIRLSSDLVDPALRGIPIHPTQLYESVSLFLLFAALVWVFRRKKFDGQVTLTYFMAYPIIRSIIEIFRGDSIRGFLIDEVLSTSQAISILVFLGALTVLIIRLKRLPNDATRARQKTVAQ